MSGTHEHLEQAEHAGHEGGHGPDPFTMRVAMTMALIAAFLAAISLIGHRKHNEALQKQNEGNRFRTESAASVVESSNTFAYYQAKRARVEQRVQSIDFAKLFAPAPNSDKDRADAVKKWKSYIERNSNTEKDIELDESGFPKKLKDGEEDQSPGALLVRGRKFKEIADEKTKKADELKDEFNHAHHQADGLDWAHLAVELGLVLCTICVLTKKREFWFTGILAAIIGVGMGGYSLFLLH